MDGFIWVGRLLLLAVLVTAGLALMIFWVSPHLIDWLGLQISRGTLTSSVVGAIGAASLVGLQFHGRLFAERSHLDEQWAKGQELLYSSEDQVSLRGILMLTELALRARWSYQSAVVDCLADYLRDRKSASNLVQERVINSICKIENVRWVWIRFPVLRAVHVLPWVKMRKVDLSGITFKVPFYWSGLACHVSLVFDGSVFRAEMRMEGAKILGDVSAKGCRFHEDALFEGVKIMGEVNLEDSRFEKRAGFQKSKFGSAFLAESTLFSKVDFSDAKFMKKVVFSAGDRSHENFRESALFQRVEFQGDAHFGSVHQVASTQAKASVFAADVTFEGAVFHRDALFQGVTFARGANFSASRRRRDEGEANKAARFCRLVDFSGATFGDKDQVGRQRDVTNFEGVVFEGQLKADDVHPKSVGDDLYALYARTPGGHDTVIRK